MATIDGINVIIGAEITALERGLSVAATRLRSFESNVESSASRLGSFSDVAASVGGGISKFVTLPLSLLGAASIKAAGDIQALEKGFAATYKGSLPLQDALQRVRELAKLPGLGLKEALQGATNLQAAGFSADLATRALGAFGNALATVGKGKADLDGVGLALGQIASKGKISAEEINQLAERVPQIRAAMKGAFGTADTEVLNKAGIGATEFVEKVTAELEKLPKVSGGINNAFENFSDGVTIALSKVGTSLNRAFDIEGVVSRVADFLTGLADSFAALSPEVQKAIFVVGGVVAVAGPVLAAIAAITAAAPALGVAFTVATGPVGLAVVAVGAAVAGIILYWDELKAYLQGDGAGVFNAVKNVATEAMAYLRQIIGQTVQVVTALWRTFGPVLVEEFKVAFELVSTIVSGALNAIAGVFKLFGALLRGDWAAAWEAVKNIAVIALNTITQTLAVAIGGSLSILGKFAKAVGADGVAGALANASAYVRRLGESFLISTGAAQTVTAEIDNTTGAVTELGKANALTGGTTPINADAAKQAQDMQKALEKLREALRDNEQLSLALGERYDYLGERAKILEGGIKSLVTVGFGPASAVVRGFRSELDAIPQALDALDSRLSKGIAAPKVEAPKEQRAFDVPALGLPALTADTSFGEMARLEAEKYRLALESLTPAQRAAADSQAAFNTEMEELVDSIGLRFQSIGEVAGQAFGSFITGASTAGEALRAALGGVIGVLAEFMKDYGKKLIVLGSGSIALGNVGQGIAQIAAGTAIIAAAGIGAAVGGSLGRGSGGGGSRPGSIGSVASSPMPRQATATQIARQQQGEGSGPTQTIVVELVANGRDLRNVMTLEQDRFGRVTGRR